MNLFFIIPSNKKKKKTKELKLNKNSKSPNQKKKIGFKIFYAFPKLQLILLKCFFVENSIQTLRFQGINPYLRHAYVPRSRKLGINKMR